MGSRCDYYDPNNNLQYLLTKRQSRLTGYIARRKSFLTRLTVIHSVLALPFSPRILLTILSIPSISSLIRTHRASGNEGIGPLSAPREALNSLSVRPCRSLCWGRRGVAAVASSACLSLPQELLLACAYPVCFCLQSTAQAQHKITCHGAQLQYVAALGTSFGLCGIHASPAWLFSFLASWRLHRRGRLGRASGNPHAARHNSLVTGAWIGQLGAGSHVRAMPF